MERKLTDDEKARIKTTCDIIMALIQSNKAVFDSWGASDFLGRLIGDSPALSFKVNGFICRGHCTIVFNDSCGGFDVYTYKPDGYKQAEQRGVQLHELQSVCDRMIETADDSDPKYIAKANSQASADIKKALDILDDIRKAGQNQKTASTSVNMRYRK